MRFRLLDDKTIAWILTAAAFVMMLSKPARADHNDVVHFAAHVGTAYAGTMLCYGVGKKVLGKEWGFFTVPMCGMLVMVTGHVYDQTAPNKSSSVLQNGLGVGTAVGSIMVFDF